MNMQQHNNGPELASKREFLLSSMRGAALNCKALAHDIETIGVALRDGLMSLDAACEALDDIGVLRWLPHEAATYEVAA